MKKIAFCSILFTLTAVCSIFSACQNEELNDGEATYIGKVVYIGSDRPYKNLEVRVTNGAKIHAMVHTNEDGEYRISVKVSEVDGGYYILVGDSSCIKKELQIPSFARKFVNMPITEISVKTGLPEVETLDPEDNVSETSVMAIGNILYDGENAITDCGFVYSTFPYPTHQNAKAVSAGVVSSGYFSVKISNITPGETVYYIRAYATNAKGTTYGNQIITNPDRVKYLHLPTIEYGGFTYHVYPDVAPMTLSDAQNFCNNMNYAGYTDWFVPNTSELQALMESNIGGWVEYNVNISAEYLTSDRESLYFYFDDGRIYRNSISSTSRCRVRPVRKDVQK